MSKLLEILEVMLGHLKDEARVAVETNDKKKAIKILRQINKILPEQFQNELLE